MLPDFNDTGKTVRRMEVPQNFTPTLVERKSKDLPLASYKKKKKKPEVIKKIFRALGIYISIPSFRNVMAFLPGNFRQYCFAFIVYFAQ